jgi:hypothetical protein
MAYLICVGARGTARYVGSLASRGYWVFRRGSQVVVRYGAIRVVRHRYNEFRWAHRWRERVYKYRGVDAAKAALNRIIAEKTGNVHGYDPLPRGHRIL